MNEIAPGSWAYRPREYDDWGTVRTAFGAFVCQARFPYRDEAELGEHRANKTDPWKDAARLIAAAPEMLGALRNFVVQAGVLRGFESEVREVAGDKYWQCLIDASAQAEAAIARATSDDELLKLSKGQRAFVRQEGGK